MAFGSYKFFSRWACGEQGTAGYGKNGAASFKKRTVAFLFTSMNSSNSGGPDMEHLNEVCKQHAMACLVETWTSSVPRNGALCMAL